MEEYRVWLRYNDGVEGVIDLSDMVEREPFAPWRDRGSFETAVHVDEWGSIRWSDELDFCRTALYMEIAGQPPEDVLVTPEYPRGTRALLTRRRQHPRHDQLERSLTTSCPCTDQGEGRGHRRNRKPDDRRRVSLPKAERYLVIKWAALRQDELRVAWNWPLV